jgi:SNF2 family DNA or RNA helicase
LRLEDLKKGTRIKGILSGITVTVVDAQFHGSSVVTLIYQDPDGKLHNELLYRDREASLEIIEPGRTWSFNVDGELLRLVSEAYRINLAHLFDPLLAVHTSLIDPLPHQITAVYGEMLTRQPLRYLLADDPGSGKTIMAGLLIKELIVRGDLARCLICCPGGLVHQWQDELWQRFQLDFNIISNQSIEDSKSGNPYAEMPLAISRLDHMSRNESIKAKLEQVEWDLVIVDEAHKMSAHYYGQEVKETQRYKLGQLLGSPNLTRHLLLMTATPHNGKEEDFQLFMSLLDSDRFEGKFRDGVHVSDTSDLMRRLVKEQLVKFDGTPLFPERRANTVTYDLSDLEAILYKQVTDYVVDEMNRADRLTAEGEGRRGNRIGFALTTLQRRLASSPEAIYRSLERRRERLEGRLREEKISKRGDDLIADMPGLPDLDDEYLEDLLDGSDTEIQAVEDQVIEQASAARTIAELEIEIVRLKELERLADQVRKSGTDRKWEELSNLLQNQAEMFDPNGLRRKLIIFSEHKDTINYLIDRIRTLLGRNESVVTIHGGIGREQRRNIQESFIQDPLVQILVATDAAGEGVNLQRAHLMVNYDLPWNPNRLEQRFGRIHRIGQTEVCHMWNLVAHETREGEVFQRLLSKLDVERLALGGRVFDILGEIFEGTKLRKLLMEAIQYGERPEVKARLNQIVDSALDHDHLIQLLDERALANNAMDASMVRQIREDMERAEARRLQPHFIRSFFLAAFKQLGGTIVEREPRRYEIKHVPAVIRSRDRIVGIGEALQSRYERICFDKEQLNVQGKPPAAFVCPGHPLLDSTIDLILERYRDLLRMGAVLIDPTNISDQIRALFYLDHSIQDGRVDQEGNRRIISRQMQFVEIDGVGTVRTAGYAPYLDYRPIKDEEMKLIAKQIETSWLSEDLEPQIIAHAAEHIVPQHLDEVRHRKTELVIKIKAAVKERLTKEITYWDHRANELKQQELAGKTNAKLNSGKARQRADNLEARLQKRMAELDRELQISPTPPVIIGGALIVPEILLTALGEESNATSTTFALDKAKVERLAMDKVMAHEVTQGRIPRDVSADKIGYDIESASPNGGGLTFIEVKGRRNDATTITISKNEILTGLNKPENYILAIVLVDGDNVEEPIYIDHPFQREPDFAVTSVNYSIKELTSSGVGVS